MEAKHKLAAAAVAGLVIFGMGNALGDAENAKNAPTVTAEASGTKYPTLARIGAEIAASEEAYTDKTERLEAETAEAHAEAEKAKDEAKELRKERRKAKDAPPVVNIDEITETERIEFIDAGYRGDPKDASDNILYNPNHRPDHVPDYVAEKPIIEETVCLPNASWFGLTSFPETHNLVQVNECLIRSMGGDDADVANTWAHERAHAAGLDHFEDSPDTNPAYFPTQELNDGH